MSNKKDRQVSETESGILGSKFTVGDGVSWGFNGDRYPGTVMFVSDSGRKVYASEDTYKVIDTKGAYVEGNRECVFTTVNRPLEECMVFTLRKNGLLTDHPGHGLTLCHGRQYAQNPSF